MVAPKGILFGGIKAQPTGSGALLFMNRWFVSKVLKAHDFYRQYDRFVITRTDYFYSCYLGLGRLDRDKIWVPHGEDWLGGLCDRWYLCDQKHILASLDLLPELLKNPRRYTSNQGFLRANPEWYLRRRWEKEGFAESGEEGTVQRFPRKMFIARTEGDSSRWNAAAWLSEKDTETIYGPSVHYKYATEYGEAISVCYPST